MHSRIRSISLLLLGLCALTACQSYDPMPLDEPEAIRAWRARDHKSADVAEFARQLQQRGLESRGPYNTADGIDLHEAEVLALFFNPQLRTARLAARAELDGAREAGRWEDPSLSIEAGWILGNTPSPWIIGASIEFTIPLSGRPGVEQDLAFAQHEVKRREVVALEWSVLEGLRKAWRELAVARAHVALLDEHIARVQEVDALARELSAAGELSRGDARMVQIELATSTAARMQADAKAQSMQLDVLEWMGLQPRAPVTLLPGLAAETAKPDELRLRACNPLLELKRAEYEVSEQRLRLEVRKQFPDLHIGPGYELEDGQSKITLAFGIPIPLINLNKEGIARARGERLAARAAFEGELEGQLHRLARAEQARAAAELRYALLQGEIAPLVDEHLTETLKLAKLGEFDAMRLTEALSRRLEAQLELLQAKADQAAATDELLMAHGPSFTPEPVPEE